jgi:hypothetical protein
LDGLILDVLNGGRNQGGDRICAVDYSHNISTNARGKTAWVVLYCRSSRHGGEAQLLVYSWHTPAMLREGPFSNFKCYFVNFTSSKYFLMTPIKCFFFLQEP